MKNILSVILICLLSGSLLSQKYYTKEGRISFHSDAPLEKIEAENNKASSVIDTENGNIQWAVSRKHIYAAIIRKNTITAFAVNSRFCA